MNQDGVPASERGARRDTRRGPTARAGLLVLSAAILAWGVSRPIEPHRAGIEPSRSGGGDRGRVPADVECSRCHPRIVESYRRHPMGHSLATIEAWLAAGATAMTFPARFEAQGLEYTVETSEGRVIHREARRDSDGRAIIANQAEIRYVLGSGKQALSFLIDRDGFLFESPITYYVQERRWGLSPGYEKRNRHFHRPILADCLFCHTNRVERASGAVNQFARPIFRGHAIGCERCHGPTEPHLARPVSADGPTIVNPASLEPSLRDAVCEQCHLIGRRRVVRAGLRSEDYRPGLPFQRFWAAFVAPPGAGDQRFAGQVEQMHESRCFRDSRGQLGCITCHDPHAVPGPGAAVAYYRSRCLECHADRGCRLPVPVRLGRRADDDCTACHMPRGITTNNAHLATTDHRILRDAGSSARSTAKAGGLASFVNFHAGLMDRREREAAERDRGVAFCRDGPEGAAMALPRLEAALSRDPEDAIAWVSKAAALHVRGRDREAFAAYQEAVRRDPTREGTVEEAADVAARTGRREEALALWQKAIAINPWRPHYYAELARAAARLGDWRAATDACGEALRLEPFDIETRKRLVQGLLRTSRMTAAQVEFERLLRSEPSERDALLRWYAAQGPHQ